MIHCLLFTNCSGFNTVLNTDKSLRPWILYEWLKPFVNLFFLFYFPYSICIYLFLRLQGSFDDLPQATKKVCEVSLLLFDLSSKSKSVRKKQLFLDFDIKLTPSQTTQIFSPYIINHSLLIRTPKLKFPLYQSIYRNWIAKTKLLEPQAPIQFIQFLRCSFNSKAAFPIRRSNKMRKDSHRNLKNFINADDSVKILDLSFIIIIKEVSSDKLKTLFFVDYRRRTLLPIPKIHCPNNIKSIITSLKKEN